MKADKDNGYMRQHQKNMRDFDKSFNEAEKDAYVRSATDAGKSKKIALIAVAAALFIIGFIGAFMVEPLKQSATKASISNNSQSVNDVIYSYLENGDYEAVSDYSDSIGALDNDAFEKQYPVLMGARYFKWAEGFMHKDNDNINLKENDVANLSSYLEEFYYYTQMSAYKDKKAAVTDENRTYLERMQKDMGGLLKKYYHLTDEDIMNISTYSGARINRCLVERSITDEK